MTERVQPAELAVYTETPWVPTDAAGVKARIRERAQRMGVKFDTAGNAIVEPPVRVVPADDDLFIPDDEPEER